MMVQTKPLVLLAASILLGSECSIHTAQKPHPTTIRGTGFFTAHVSHEKKTSYFPLNPGCLMT